ncbi:hypothetical protein [uncultured Aquimarina sp.]|uniref:hypothetical protein n=1 Tax=uncultured Aquimarina sp. TaxID=575652 RepID=UPI0026236CD8|nr:hypothetical protein [uncultured Aquimarina sp.]
MRKVLLFLCVLVSGFSVFGQNTTFDNLTANYGRSKSITWFSSNYGSGFGHRILNTDPGGQTLLNFQGRHNSSTWSDILTLTSNGNVGIGTTNPQSKLEIKQSGTIGGTWNPSGSFLTISDSGSSKMIIDSNEIYGSGTLHIGSKTGDIIRFRTVSENSTSDKVVIKENGNVGIGTTTPSAKLQIEGQTKVGKWGVLTLDWTNETNWGGSSNKWAGYIGFNSSRNDEDPKDYYKGNNKYTSKGVFEGSNYGFRWLYRNHNNHDSDAQHQLSEYMRLTNDGNLGIGTTNTQGYKLAIAGKAVAEEVKVALQTNWPDYVFKDTYQLPTLQQVEDHITTKGHLINIPSAAEVSENGIQLGEMNAKLLEKIEELTLYTIAQEKRLKEQQKTLIKQEDEISVLKSQSSRINKLEEKLNQLINNK